MLIDKVVYKRIVPDTTLQAKKMQQGPGVSVKRIESIKPMRRVSQDASTD